MPHRPPPRSLHRRLSLPRAALIGSLLAALALPASAASPAAAALRLASPVALVQNLDSGHTPLARGLGGAPRSIASITKLMTAMVVLDSNAPLDEVLTITQAEVKIYAKSRLSLGTKLTREEALLLALMSSENRASQLLATNYPGGLSAFIEAMNHKAYALGMTQSSFTDPTGLLASNVSTGEDLARLLIASYNYKLIREFSVWPDMTMVINKRPQVFLNTNRLVRAGDMEIGLQKTGFISAAGRCLVMQAKVNGMPLLLVFLDSVGTQSRFADAVRVKDWIESYQPGEPKPIRRLTM